MRGETPSTATDLSFGGIEIQCWQAYYHSVNQLKVVAISTADAQLDAIYTDGSRLPRIESLHTISKNDERRLDAMAVERNVFLKKARGEDRPE